MNWTLLVFGLAVHLVFFYSIFDIYFTSPLVHGMTPHVNPLPPPAKRLVLFVADGLRADRLFELDKNGRTRAPYIRDVIRSSGAWGVSHTRVPTESRPGNVAIIAGFYEDVSAVAKGWKENPVDFDSVFNETRHTWAWGSPDILPMFAKGASGDHVFVKMYPAESEDFAGEDSSKLDTWVFDEVQDLLQQAAHNTSLSEMLRQDQVIFFLHLLGIDVNGHAHRPNSMEYLENIQLVDDGIKHIQRHLEGFFGNDGQTAYILTSDHGMTNWGSHGAGHPSETLTPLVAWGAGLRGPQVKQQDYQDDFQQAWRLEDLERSDVNQADISPLMASLIGVPFPLNSVGVLPLDYMDNSQEFKARSILTNALQIVEQFEVKMRQKQETTLDVFFTPYKSLLPSKKISLIRDIQMLIAAARYSEAISRSQELIQLALEGLNYYHNYDRVFLGTSIALGFVAWMSYLVMLIFMNHTSVVRPKSRLEALTAPWLSSKTLRLIFSVLALIVVILLRVQSLPWTYYVYCLVPVLLGHKVAQHHNAFTEVQHYIIDNGYTVSAVVMVTLGILGMEIVVASFFWRNILSVGLVAMAAWPFTTPVWNSNKLLCLGWVASCLSVAIFPLLPVVGRDANYNLVFLAGIITLVLGVYAITRQGKSNQSSHDLSGTRSRTVLTVFQLCVVCVSVVIVMSTSSNIASKRGLPLLNQICSWAILGMSFIVPMLSSTHVGTRLTSITLAFLAPYLLLSTSHESLFCLALTGLMVAWLHMEHAVANKRAAKLSELDFVSGELLGERQRYLEMADIRCAFFFIFFLVTAFFGTGNIASINSFDPTSVLCFLTVFSPFTMGALMLWKILIPFMLVTCAFNAIHVSVNVPTQSLFLLVLLMSDFMGLHFFFLVQDHGSWLEIGTSISHYVIVMAMICFLLLLLALSKVFTTVTLTGRSDKKAHDR